MPISILVADEELWAFRQVFQEACGGEARLIPAWPIALAQDLIRRAQPDWIFLGAGDSGAAQACRQVRRWAPRARLIGVGGPARAEAALELARLGMEGLLSRPLATPALRTQIAALLAVENSAAASETELPVLIGEDDGLEQARQLIEKVAPTDASVLLRGESGTGKEVAAGLIHRLSLRHAAPFIKLNCAAIPRELLESELFGYEPGAFTGASRKKAGKFELAHGGTIFLDEISELHPSMQAKLLHILQDGEFSRLGAEASQTAEARVIAASNLDLEAAVAAGRFRADLYYRLNVVSVRLPPLRERAGDIPYLVEYFRRRHARQYGAEVAPLSPDAMSRLQQYPWPGNVRELENFVRRYLILADEAQALDELAKPAREGTATMPRPGAPVLAASQPSLIEIGRRAAREAERAAILGALEQTRWNRRQAARLLKVSYKALHNKLRDMKQDAAPPPVRPAGAMRPWPAAEGRSRAAAAG